VPYLIAEIIAPNAINANKPDAAIEKRRHGCGFGDLQKL
jgi:hypothetical protein